MAKTYVCATQHAEFSTPSAPLGFVIDEES